ncbi:unnamed protein product [Heterobilharzia americana]|nr:unnamed protein product [Heterobilharzia americana]
MTPVGESLREANWPMCLLSMKAKVNVGTWNVRTMFEPSKAAQIAKEMRRYHIEVLGICESRWNGSGLSKLSTGESIIYSGHPDDNHEHTELWSGYHDVLKSIEGSHAVGTNLLQDHDSKIQLKRKKGHNHTMLCTYK